MCRAENAVCVWITLFTAGLLLLGCVCVFGLVLMIIDSVCLCVSGEKGRACFFTEVKAVILSFFEIVLYVSVFSWLYNFQVCDTGLLSWLVDLWCSGSWKFVSYVNWDPTSIFICCCFRLETKKINLVYILGCQSSCSIRRLSMAPGEFTFWYWLILYFYFPLASLRITSIYIVSLFRPHFPFK